MCLGLCFSVVECSYCVFLVVFLCIPFVFFIYFYVECIFEAASDNDNSNDNNNDNNNNNNNNILLPSSSTFHCFFFI